MLEQVKALRQLEGNEHILDIQRKLIWVGYDQHAVVRMLVSSKIHALKS